MRVGFPVDLLPTRGMFSRAFLTGFLLRKRLLLRLPCANAEGEYTGPRAPRPNSAYRGPLWNRRLRHSRSTRIASSQILQKIARPSRLILVRYAKILYDARQLTSVVNLWNSQSIWLQSLWFGTPPARPSSRDAKSPQES